jgi:hypothetical protein
MGLRDNAIAIGYCFPIIGAILTLLRFYSRRTRNARLSIDDWLTIPAWVSRRLLLRRAGRWKPLKLTFGQLFLTGCSASLLTGRFQYQFTRSNSLFNLSVGVYKDAFLDSTKSMEQQRVLAQVSID